MTTGTTRRGPLDWFFQITLIVKGLDGVVELISGAILLFVTPAQLGAFARNLTRHELSEDPNNVVANTLMHWATSINLSTSLFVAFYLLLHGAIKVVLVWAVLRNHHWAYPWMIAFLLAFIAYQSYLMVLSFTWSMLALTAFDLIIVALTVREYRLRRAPRPDRIRAH